MMTSAPGSRDRVQRETTKGDVMTAMLLLACCLYCEPPTAADPWQDRDRIPKELVFPPAERQAVENGYPYNLEGKSGNLPERDWINRDHDDKGDADR